MNRVLLIANDSAWVYNLRLEIIKKLISTGYEVSILTPFTSKVEELELERVKLYNSSLKRNGTNPVSDLKVLIEYCKTIQALKPDIVLSYTIKPNVYGGIACQLTKIPYLANVTGLGTAVENGGLMSLLTTSLYKIGLKNCNCIFFQNAENMDFFEKKKMRGKKKRLIPGSGVNLERFQLLEYPEEDKIGLLYIGRILENKGIGEFLATAEYIKGKYSEVTFSIVGFFDETKYEPLVEELVKKGIIQFHGQQSDVKPFLANCSALVLPSYHEGLSNVLLEASASGRPVLTTNVSGCKETFDEGSTGFGCEARSSDGLIEIVERFIQLPYEKKIEMGRKAREKVEKEFSRNIVIDAYMEEIQNVLE